MNTPERRRLAIARQPDRRTDTGMTNASDPVTRPADPRATSTDERAFLIDPSRDPRDVFLTTTQVHAYLGKGRAQGYAFTGSVEFQAIAAWPGTWRLADVRAFFDAKFASAIAQIPPGATSDASPEAEPASQSHATDAVPAAENIAPAKPARSRRAPASTTTTYPYTDVQRRSAAPGTKRKARTR
jgi:hypothetical protein